MARNIDRLTALQVKKTSIPGMYPDGAGLYLRVTKEGTKNWVLRFMLAGRPRWMGLGPFPLFGLEAARAKALDARRMRHEGVDPIDARRNARRQAQLEAAKAITFKECAEAYMAAHQPVWRNPRHAKQWPSTLQTYAYPVIGSLPVQSIDTALVTKIIEPIWSKKSETANRLRGRVEVILNWAKVRGYRTGENPARWRGHLDHLLPSRTKVRTVKHHAALPYTAIGTFVSDLRSQEGTAARALEFVILTAARTNEVIGATWGEIDLTNKVWTIPPDRMKAKREHRVPLSTRAVEILTGMKKIAGKDIAHGAPVFANERNGKPLSNMACSMLLRRMERADFTVHGFRSTFRDWASEQTNFPGEMAEMALAHAISNKVEAAYRRGDLFERRRRMMTDWAAFCGEPRSSAKNFNVAVLHRKA